MGQRKRRAKPAWDWECKSPAEKTWPVTLASNRMLPLLGEATTNAAESENLWTGKRDRKTDRNDLSVVNR